ncbi:possible transcriptional regulator [Alloactinosynnema sp. L-07]|uniref:LuxR C-terminal-related transcriptional regulator n=1 Tax=Alloactinosynnema sp. L-07 TaxID=1653480 RepID=UPI00065F09E5|nr:LuxR C-terminal-related transcriptional regulator [Alloactinosynnema sp. L-07]CRK56483.1 possible transcriptional regulator [Alloactinosynnema sp. L-07]
MTGAHPSPTDLSAMGDAEWWVGNVDEALAAAEAAFHGHEQAGMTRPAAMAALDLAGLLFMRGDEARCETWMNRAALLLRDEPDCLESTYLRFLAEVETSPDLDAVVSGAREVSAAAKRFGDPSLVAAATMAEGRALIRKGHLTEGFTQADQAIAAILGGGLHPVWAGHLYCRMIEICHELVDLPRMRRWTQALGQWCADQSNAVVFTGICRVHQAQLRQISGQWAQSETDAQRTGTDLAGVIATSAAEAHYVIGEARRLRQDHAGAEQAYLQAHELGRDPQPGLALLRLSQGRTDVALRSIQSALTAEDSGLLARVRLCAAAVDIAIAAGAIDVARKATDELMEAAAHYVSPGLEAMAWQAQGAVLLAEGNPEEALPILRRTCTRWRNLEAPHDCARVRLLLAQTYKALGDDDASDREQAAATTTLTTLGVAPPSTPPSGLTARELDVLLLVAAGKTNRETAAALVLSDKTVARHLANIYLKLNVSSRTAAAAYAFDHGLVTRPSGI